MVRLALWESGWQGVNDPNWEEEATNPSPQVSITDLYYHSNVKF